MLVHPGATSADYSPCGRYCHPNKDCYFGDVHELLAQHFRIQQHSLASKSKIRRSWSVGSILVSLVFIYLRKNVVIDILRYVILPCGIHKYFSSCMYPHHFIFNILFECTGSTTIHNQTLALVV